MKKKLPFAIVDAGTRGIDCFSELLEARPDAEIAVLYDTNPVRLNEAKKLLKR